MVVGIHADLVVAGESIHETEEFMACCGIYNEVDPWQMETIFWACLVDVSEVDAESPLAVRFFDEYDVSKPFRILHFSDCPCLEELADLLIYCFLSFWSETPLFCLTGLKDGLTFSL